MTSRQSRSKTTAVVADEDTSPSILRWFVATFLLLIAANPWWISETTPLVPRGLPTSLSDSAVWNVPMETMLQDWTPITIPDWGYSALAAAALAVFCRTTQSAVSPWALAALITGIAWGDVSAANLTAIVIATVLWSACPRTGVKQVAITGVVIAIAVFLTPDFGLVAIVGAGWLLRRIIAAAPSAERKSSIQAGSVALLVSSG
ncbi:MAG: hypothetical protein KDA96_26405, partial [Planctomycetaceae bacterium]|nr:hypothetical protein [Planctomycetaceae bacterium]